MENSPIFLLKHFRNEKTISFSISNFTSASWALKKSIFKWYYVHTYLDLSESENCVFGHASELICFSIHIHTHNQLTKYILIHGENVFVEPIIHIFNIIILFPKHLSQMLRFIIYQYLCFALKSHDN